MVSEDSSAREVTFQLRSTHGSAFPSWSAGAAPTAAAIGRNRFVLKRLEHLAEKVPFSQATAFFECFEGERPVHHWRPDRIAVSDATGKLVETTSNGEPSDRFTFDALCRFEPAWKLRTTFVRDGPLGKPDFTWKVDGVGAPGRGERVKGSQSARRGALSLKLTDIRGGSRYSFPTVSVEAENSPEEYQLALLAVSDQAGRPIPVDGSTAIQLVQGPSQTLAYDFGPYPRGAKKLNLTFGIYGAQTVDFMVKP